MAEFMMLMKGVGPRSDWDKYVTDMINTGKFRGGSSLGNGVCTTNGGQDQKCTVTGFMRFEAASIDEVKELLAGNPVYEAGGEVELLELVQE